MSKTRTAARPARKSGVTGKLCVLLVLLDVITRVRVPVLPGWQVPLPALLIAAVFIGCATMLAWLVLRTPRLWPGYAAPASGGQAAS